jgi:hypothetical protein
MRGNSRAISSETPELSRSVIVGSSRVVSIEQSGIASAEDEARDGLG